MINDKYLGFDFYEIFEEHGRKFISVFGFFYDSVDKGDGKQYRKETYRGFEVPLEEFLSEEFDIDSYQESLTHYVEDLTEDECDLYIAENMDDRFEVPYGNLTMDIPCGMYVDAA